jgi:hypothetical protein
MANFKRNRPKKQPNKCLCCSWWRWQGNKAARKDQQRHKADLSAAEQIADSDTYDGWEDRMKEKYGPYWNIDDDQDEWGLILDPHPYHTEWDDWEEWKEKNRDAA